MTSVPTPLVARFIRKYGSGYRVGSHIGEIPELRPVRPAGATGFVAET